MNTREQILAATERIIQEKGLARVTTREIAREVGCSEGTLYKHFVGKESLFLTVVQTCVPDLVDVVQVEMAGKQSVRENLEAIAHAAISYYEKLLPLSLSLFADQDLLARQRQWMQEQQVGPLNIYHRVALYIQAEQQLGRIKQELAPFTIAAALLGPCHHYVFVQCLSGCDPFPQTEKQFVQEIVETLLLGISVAE
ncbi:MAG TPA: TetR/AcrR family transcriptional regulator [Ktedonobacteraceae bacterium]